MTDAERERMASRLPRLVTCEGHALTLHNTLLLFQQSERVDLTIVGGFKQWLRQNRCVRKGEHNIGMIMVPMKIKDKNGKVDREGNTKEHLFFRFVPVFDVTQTDEIDVD
jgi:hypothetical protein